MARCDVCRNDYENTMEIRLKGVTGTYDCFECATQWLRPASIAAVGSSGMGWTRGERSSAVPTARRRPAPTRFMHEVLDDPLVSIR